MVWLHQSISPPNFVHLSSPSEMRNGIQKVGIGMGLPMGMGMPMMPVPTPMHHLVGNPFDQGMEIEYSPITQLVSSVAHLLEMHQRSKEKENDRSGHHISYGTMFPELFQMQSSRRPGLTTGVPFEIPSSRPRFNLIPYSQEAAGGSTSSSTSRLINAIPQDNIPPVMWRIGDLIGRPEPKQKENLYDMNKIKGFPIVKSTDGEEVFRNEEIKNKTNRSWTILEIARKMLGVDEIPTSREGNAIAQLIEDLRKEKEANNSALK